MDCMAFVAGKAYFRNVSFNAEKFMQKGMKVLHAHADLEYTHL